MQNNSDSSKSGGFRKFFQEKGYYIVLFLCIVAVGISGYIFVSNAIAEKNSLNESLSVATNATVPSDAQSNTGKENQTAKASAEQAETAEAASILDGDDAVRAAAEAVRVWPVSGSAVMAYSVDKLSYNTTVKDWRTHEGVDLAAVAGTPVKAACAGTVTAVYDDEFLGTTVVLSHTDGYTTQYSNLAEVPTVSVGDAVESGAVLGSVGATAILESGEDAHLHFAVYQDGAPVDPAEFIG
jgi:murein DD-endopeptidase MepM/ murein hydrolase activator NlpD